MSECFTRASRFSVNKIWIPAKGTRERHLSCPFVNFVDQFIYSTTFRSNPLASARR